MYNRLYLQCGCIRQEFLDGIETFTTHTYTLPCYINEGIIRCPCVEML